VLEPTTIEVTIRSDSHTKHILIVITRTHGTNHRKQLQITITIFRSF